MLVTLGQVKTHTWPRLSNIYLDRYTYPILKKELKLTWAISKYLNSLLKISEGDQVLLVQPKNIINKF